MAHYNTPVTIEQIDPYGNLFQVLPGSSLISFYNSIQQNVPTNHTSDRFPEEYLPATAHRPRTQCHHIRASKRA
jgi:hypothetical protein